MILYRLECENNHLFDSWFKDSQSFETQGENCLVHCPYCESSQVKKAIMSPRVVKKSERLEKKEVGEKDWAQAIENLPDSKQELDDVYKALRHIHQVVQDKCQSVGQDFPEEVRKIYYGEADYRPIYGQATLEEAQELYEEGIDFFCLPLLPRHSS